MIPMADMLNAGFEMGNVHLFGDGDEDNEANRKALEEQGPGYTMSTTKAIAKGDQIVRQVVLTWPRSLAVQRLWRTSKLGIVEEVRSCRYGRITPGDSR